MDSPTMHEAIKAMMAELKPCPFCGRRELAYSARRVRYSRPLEYTVKFRCPSCHCSTGKSLYPAKLIELWNRAERRGK